MNKTAKLILEDGTIFTGISFGAPTSTAGEVVFATGMVGYDLSLTDPSYAGQILTFTYPLIGNWGVPPKEFLESSKIHVKGLIISDLTTTPSHWQKAKTLDTWLKEENIPGIYGIDTRVLTQKLRQKGVMLGKIVAQDKDVDFWDPNTENLVQRVSPKQIRVWKPSSGWQAREGSRQRAPHLFLESELDNGIVNNQKRLGSTDGKETTDRTRVNVALLNCGAKQNIARCLTARGATVYDLPWDYDPFENNLRLDGLFISNGPGDPKMADKSIKIIKKSLTKKIPTFGICLGNQLLALAAGGNTYKLKFGHRAQNQPTIEVDSGRCFITTQNHGFAVDEKKLPKGFKRWFFNANDNTNEGIIHEKLPFFSVQFHPEAAPGPTDTEWLFDFFLEKIEESKTIIHNS